MFVILGSALSLGAVTDFSDAMIFAMSFPNMIGMYFLAPIVKREMQAFLRYADGHEDMPLPAQQEAEQVSA